MKVDFVFELSSSFFLHLDRKRLKTKRGLWTTFSLIPYRISYLKVYHLRGTREIAQKLKLLAEERVWILLLTLGKLKMPIPTTPWDLILSTGLHSYPHDCVHTNTETTAK